MLDDVFEGNISGEILLGQNFGDKLTSLREEFLEYTQTQLAEKVMTHVGRAENEAIGEHVERIITQENIRKWEANQAVPDNDIVRILAMALAAEADLNEETLRDELQRAAEYTRVLLENATSVGVNDTNTFGHVLVRIREESLMMTQTDLAIVSTEKVKHMPLPKEIFTRHSIRDFEMGEKPSKLFVHCLEKVVSEKLEEISARKIMAELQEALSTSPILLSSRFKKNDILDGCSDEERKYFKALEVFYRSAVQALIPEGRRADSSLREYLTRAGVFQK